MTSRRTLWCTKKIKKVACGIEVFSLVKKIPLFQEICITLSELAEDTLPIIDIFQVTTVKPQKFNFSQLKINAEMPLCMICQILSHSLDAFSKMIRFNLTAPVAFWR